MAEGKGKHRRSLHEAFGQESGDTAHLPNPSQWPHNVYDPSHYLGAYVPASRDEEAILRRSLGVVLRRHGIEKVMRTTEEVWQARKDREEVREGN